jgi:hypothetical protein
MIAALHLPYKPVNGERCGGGVRSQVLRVGVLIVHHRSTKHRSSTTWKCTLADGAGE